MRTALTQNWLVCRICLQSKDKMDSIFSEDTEKDLTKMILECGGVPIKQFDHYPDKICFQCDKSLKIAYKFRMTCQRSHRHLSKFIAAPVVIEEADIEILKNEELIGEEDIEETFNDDVVESLFSEDAVGGFSETKIFDDRGIDVTETIQNDLMFPEDTDDTDDVALKLEAVENDSLNIKKEMSELDEAEIVDFYEPIEDVEIFDEYEEEEQSEEVRATSALSEEIEYLDEILNEEELVESDEEYLPSIDVPETSVEQQTPKGRGRPKGSKNSKKPKDGASSSNSLASKGKIPDRRGRKPKNPDFTVYICDICGNTYPTQGRLTDHIKKHNPVKHHECEICGHAFVQAQQLSRHMNTHTGNRPYKCNYCPAAFADLSTRNKHHRIHTNERPYVCDVCGKAFAYTNTLKFHKMIHTGEKPFVCNICGKGFHQAYKLRNHKRTHEKRAIKAKKLELEFQELSDATSQLLEM